MVMELRLPLSADVEFLSGDWNADELVTALNALLLVVDVTSCHVDNTQQLTKPHAHNRSLVQTKIRTKQEIKIKILLETNS